ncbi:MAG: hypothetical protein RL095_2939 [Verrucomicrobiota bacterium]|jgi:tRNA/tmRNA/rRNA uracil-C5-methylase (TrmA/RlmC/RlmD family)
MSEIRVDELVEIQAHGTALGGEAVGKLPDGRACFIPFALPGEKLRVRIKSLHAKHARAEIAEILEASPQRVEAQCPLYGRCGGCQYQHATYDEQLRLKTTQLLETLRRLGGVPVEKLDEVIAAPSAWNYRNRISLHPVETNRGLRYGYTALDNQEILPVDKCPLARDEVNAEIRKLGKSDYGRKNTRRDTPRDVSIRWAPGSGTVCLFGSAPPNLPWRKEDLAGLPYSVPAGSFSQVNPEVGSLLFDLVGRWGASIPYARAVDAYCGAGFLGLALQGKPVFGIENDGPGIEAARVNAVQRGCAGTHKYEAGDAGKLLDAALRLQPENTLLILDPPRAGCSDKAIASIASRKPRWILYVSCEPSTLARDLKGLCAAGYQLSRCALLDMFPQTAHFESAVLMERI